MIPRSLSSFLWSWFRGLRRPPRAIIECQREIARRRRDHKQTRDIADRMRRIRIEGLRREVEAKRARQGEAR